MKETNIISSYMYYMWMAFNYEECYTIWKGEEADYIWNIWTNIEGNEQVKSGVFYAELNTENREKLVKRALALYDGNKRIKQ